MRTFCFPQEVRLKTPAEYRAVFEDPFRSRSVYFTVLALPNDKSIPRLGLVISKKHAKNAVVRNRIRRQIRESFRHHQAMLVGMDIVVLLRGAVPKNLTTSEVNRCLEKQWKELAAGLKKH